MTTPQPPLIDDWHAAFLRRGVSMCIGACDRDNVPTLVRATGCQVSADRRQLTLFVSVKQAQPVLDCIRHAGTVAAVFSEPSTHRTVQFKGRDAIIVALEESDFSLVSEYRHAFTREVVQLGHGDNVIYTLLAFPSADLVGIRFTPCEGYTQTPGPDAGAPLKVGA